jgi:hypothetical protein
MCLEEELERISFGWVMMMDKGNNLSMDDEPTICETTMSLHLRELENLCLCGHFNTNPNPLLQQNPSSLQSLCVEVSTKTTKKTQNSKNPRTTTPTQQDKFTNTQLYNPKTTQQKKFHKHPTRDLKLTNTKFKSTKHPTRDLKLTNTKFKSTKHPTKRESTRRYLKLEILIENIKTPSL